MNEFERALEECLHDLEQGTSSVDECLLRHPKHATQLKPILLTAAHLAQGHDVRPSSAFKARTRARLAQHMQAHPHRHARVGFGFMRFATALAVLVLALLAAGTVYAQDALPGDALYSWKLASEKMWRAIALDPVAVDIALANRRIDEWYAVADDPVRKAQAMEGYLEVVARLRSELDAETLDQILPVIPLEQEEAPTLSPQQSEEDTDAPSLPVPLPTETPNMIPTIQVPLLLP